MATEKPKTCRYCKKEIYTNTQVEGVDYIETYPGSRWYYHKDCYEKFKGIKGDLGAVAEDHVWYMALTDYLSKELKVEINYPKLTSQWKNFLKKNMTAKGIYFAIKYFYDVKKYAITKEEKGMGIGIVPYIYEESGTYWKNLEEQQRGIVDKLSQQALERGMQKVVVVQQKKKDKKVKSFVDWDEIDNMVGDEDAG